MINPNVRSFGINASMLMRNAPVLMATDATIDTLIVYDIGKTVQKVSEKKNLLNVLRQLFQRSFYRTLTLNDVESLPEYWNSLKCPVEKLHMHNCIYNFELPVMSILDNVKELQITSKDWISLNAEEIAKNLKQLEKLYIAFDTWDYYSIVISSFVRYSIELTTIKTSHHNNLDKYLVRGLKTWRKERAKLAGANKVTIFVQENVYLKTKWATKTIEHSLIEIKRDSSCQWPNGYGAFNTIDSPTLFSSSESD